MNPRSDVDFSSPKVDLVVKLKEVAIELNRPQVGRREDRDGGREGGRDGEGMIGWEGG